jgi:hypothetical protein
MPTQTYTPIMTTTLTSNSNAVNFTVIPQTYTDLVLICTWIENSTEDLSMRVGNGSVSTTGYSTTFLIGNGSTATSSRQSLTYWDVSQIPATTTQFATTIVNFQNYSNTTTFKTAISRSGAAAAGTVAEVALWRSTSAIDTIQLRCGFGANTFNTGSTFTLYGIKAGS